jgi:hypothetical protein
VLLHVIVQWQALNGVGQVVGLAIGSEADRPYAQCCVVFMLFTWTLAAAAASCCIVQVADTDLSGTSPFQAATLIAGPDDSSTNSAVTLTVSQLRLNSCFMSDHALTKVTVGVLVGASLLRDDSSSAITLTVSQL